jgi:hypothetical protein
VQSAYILDGLLPSCDELFAEPILSLPKGGGGRWNEVNAWMKNQSKIKAPTPLLFLGGDDKTKREAFVLSGVVYSRLFIILA